MCTLIVLMRQCWGRNYSTSRRLLFTAHSVRSHTRPHLVQTSSSSTTGVNIVIFGTATPPVTCLLNFIISIVRRCLQFAYDVMFSHGLCVCFRPWNCKVLRAGMYLTHFCTSRANCVATEWMQLANSYLNDGAKGCTYLSLLL